MPAKPKIDPAKKEIAAPRLPYEPRDPKKYRPNIGLIACGGITATHLRAYKAAGYKVVALCDLILERAEKRRQEFYPDAMVCTDYREVLRRDDIEVVDIATHPPERLPLIRDALLAGKHVLSQKPFVLDLDKGRQLVELADRKGLKLAVNQNGRWSPAWSYMRHAINAGLVGQVFSVHMAVHWNHNWIKGTAFEKVRHVILYDFAIHWFDILTTFMGGKMADRVYATFRPSPSQESKQPLLAEAVVEYPQAQASLVFDADVRWGDESRTCIAGTKGTLRQSASSYWKEKVTLYTPKGWCSPKLKGKWFPDGFHGTMGELLRAIEEKRQPSNSAENNLNSLALCFAAVAAAETGRPQVPGKVRRLVA